MTRKRRFVPTLVLGLALLAGVSWRVRRPAAPLPPESDFVRPATPTEVRAAVKARGAKLTVLNVWAQWCEPCKREFPHFLRLRREWATRGVEVTFLSVDDRADLTEVEVFLRTEGVDFPTFYKGKQSLNFVAEIFPRWSGAIPATLLLGPNAELVEAWEGDTSWTELETKTSAALARLSRASGTE